MANYEVDQNSMWLMVVREVAAKNSRCSSSFLCCLCLVVAAIHYESLSRGLVQYNIKDEVKTTTVHVFSLLRECIVKTPFYYTYIYLYFWSITEYCKNFIILLFAPVYIFVFSTFPIYMTV
jgi:hypothetical protein